MFVLGRGVGIPVINILEFHMSTVPGSQTDLVLHPRMEGKRYTTNINATGVCLPNLDYSGLRVVTGCVINGTHESQMMTQARTVEELACGLYAIVFKYVRISTRNPDVIVGTWNGICFIDVFYK